ncbi:MAG: Na/Pi cotransporter family protein [Clostridia bacterium]|nr:Na/Pi cotransporter family protein [Clostridia bacterium]
MNLSIILANASMSGLDYFYTVISMLAGTGAFLFGCKVLSDGIESLANSKLKSVFNKAAKSKLANMGMGAFVTSIIQSSAATTVMVVGFVNAGIMSLYQATAIIMGANIGTTITAQIVALQSFDIVKIAMSLTIVGVFMNMLAKSDRMKTVGNTLAGLGMIFLGLEFMSDAMKVFRSSPVITDLLQKINNPFLLLFLGAAITALVQSSSAVTSIIISMAGAGLVIGSGGNSVLYVVLGTNIGTCITAMLSAVGASKNARRAATIHLMFNVFGSLLFMIVLLCIPKFNELTFMKWFAYPTTQIAMFHTVFNVVCTALFLPMTKVFVKLSTLIVKDVEEQKATATYIDRRFLKTPAVAVEQAGKEVRAIADMCMGAMKKAFEGFLAVDEKISVEIDDTLLVAEDKSKRVVEYLIELSGMSISQKDEKIIASLHSQIGDALRIGEIAENLCKYTRSTKKHGLVFGNEVKEDLKKMFGEIESLYVEAIKALEEKSLIAVKRADRIEENIDAYRKRLVDAHIKRLNDGICNPSNSAVFINLVGNLERAADHLTFIAHSVESYDII